jgi:hypothetical protein
MSRELNPTRYYRLPWTLTDNVLGWLEPTKRCNLRCEGCYSRNDPHSDKSLAQIRFDLDVLVRNRRVDSISIAGGEPLVHPEIVQIVRIIRHDYGLKPIVNTNGHALTPELVRQLKQAGCHGFTFHVDSSQHRPGRRQGRSEEELNELREQYARLVAAEGGMLVNFNSTVFPHTLASVPKLWSWALQHPGIVHGMVFILFRTTRPKEYRYYAWGREIDPGELVYYDQEHNPEPVTAQQLVAELRRVDPDFEPAAYLGGTHDPNSFKWLLATRVVSAGRQYGYLGSRAMELVQTGYHLVRGSYVAYADPAALRLGRAAMLGFVPFDAEARKTASRYVRELLRRPSALTDRVWLQSMAVIQPIDMLADGNMNMCDGCPDVTVHDGELVWSCRLEERLRFGCFLTATPKDMAQREVPAPRESGVPVAVAPTGEVKAS